jgi:hypothetical protein
MFVLLQAAAGAFLMALGASVLAKQLTKMIREEEDGTLHISLVPRKEVESNGEGKEDGPAGDPAPTGDAADTGSSPADPAGSGDRPADGIAETRPGRKRRD